MIKFNKNAGAMEEILIGRWKQNDTEYYIYDEIFDEIITVNKFTGKVEAYGFTGLISDYLAGGVFIVV